MIAQHDLSIRPVQRIRVGHSPDPDDAFMFYALAKGKIDTGRYRFSHELVDIETLNRRALEGELELTAVSVHAYAYLSHRYILCSCGASMGDRYGPMVVARRDMTLDELAKATIAVPGLRTTAYLALRLCLGADFDYVIVPFDRILDAVSAGQYQGRRSRRRLDHPRRSTDLCRPAAAIGRRHGPMVVRAHRIAVAVGGKRHPQRPGRRDDPRRTRLAPPEHRVRSGASRRGARLCDEFWTGLNRSKADQFVEMYVNHWTLDFGPVGRQAVARLLAEGHAAGVIPTLVLPEFVE